ncbi:MAG: hypothetical protein RL040_1308 [Bacteroidota bacterium]|jgi:hypothetical protein
MVFRLLLIIVIVAQSASRLSAQLSNDLCSSAIDLQPYLVAAQTAPVIAGPFSNTAATGNDVDIAAVTGCWLDDLTGLANGSSPQVDATVWFRLTGIDQEVRLEVQPCDTTFDFLSADTQLALFSGECDSLEIVDCNEDIDPATYNYWSAIYTSLSAGTEYRMVVDGFNYSGFGSPDAPLTTGEFCIHVSIPSLQVSELTTPVSTIFPNPTDDRIQVNAASEIIEVRMFNAQGQEFAVFCPKNVKTLDVVMPTESGVYVVLVQTKYQTTTHRVVRK